MNPWIFFVVVGAFFVAALAIQNFVVYFTSRWWVARRKFPARHMIGNYQVLKKQTGRIGWFNFFAGLDLSISDLGMRVNTRKFQLPKLFLPWNQLQLIARSDQLAPGFDSVGSTRERPASHVLVFDVDHPVAILLSTTIFEKLSTFLPKVPIEDYPMDAAWSIWDRDSKRGSR